MSAKTKIVVLHMKELIYTGIFAVLGILFVILLIVMFLPDKKAPATPAPDTDTESMQTASNSLYIPGIYTTELVLGDQNINVEVIVDANTITSIRMVNLNDAVTTMYPLLEPTFDSICEQVYTLQSLENITYSAENKYTSLVLLEVIRNSLDKATASPSPSASPKPR